MPNSPKGIALLTGAASGIGAIYTDRLARTFASRPFSRGATATNFWDAAGGSLEKLPEKPRSGRARHHPLAAESGRLERLRGGAAKAHSEPSAERSFLGTTATITTTLELGTNTSGRAASSTGVSAGDTQQKSSASENRSTLAC